MTHPPRWSRLLEFVEAFYEEPLAPLPPSDSGSALQEWERLVGKRYRGERGLNHVTIQDVDPAERMNAPQNPLFPCWLGVAQDPSGHSVWFVDPEDEQDDPPVFHWDDEGGEPSPSRELEHVSELLTWVVIEQTLRPSALQEYESVLGKLQPGLRFHNGYGAQVRSYLEGLELESWSVHELVIERTPDHELYVVDGRIVTRTDDAWEPIEVRVAAEAAERAALQRAEELRRSEETTRALAAKGSLTAAAELVAALEELDSLTRLETMFLHDFRLRVQSGQVLDGQRKRANELLEKHG